MGVYPLLTGRKIQTNAGEFECYYAPIMIKTMILLASADSWPLAPCSPQVSKSTVPPSQGPP